MPDRPHHTDKFKRCVDEVIAKGHEESSAYAICTTSLKKAGEPIFEGAESRSEEEVRLLEESLACEIKPINDKWILFTKGIGKCLGIYKTHEDALAHEQKHRAALDAYSGEVRHLHIRNALGVVHMEPFSGKDYLVIPVIALMEGVIHAVNAETPERITMATLQKAASSWENKPIVLGHPKRDGRQCSADDPEIRATYAFGFIKNSRILGKKLLMDAWVDPFRAQELGGEDFVNDLRNGAQIEVSVGAYVRTDHSEGEENGKPYKGTWLETSGDHLAFLPDGRGACSIEMGCGANRAASHFVTTDGLELRAAAGARHSASDMGHIQEMHDRAVKLGAACDRKNYGLEGKPCKCHQEEKQ